MIPRAFSRRPSPPGVVLLMLLLGLPAASVLGQQAAPAPKIAVVDLERVFLASKAGIKLAEDLKQIEETTQKELDGHRNRINELQASLASASADEVLGLTRQQEDIERAAARATDNARRRAARLEQESRAEFNQQVQPIFTGLQAERGYDLILNKTPGVVIFAGPTLEITQDVIQRLPSE